MAGHEQPTIIEDREEEVKLSFKNIFSFFSSLDYLRFLELEGAFEEVKSKELYYVGERAALLGFVIKKVIPQITLFYWIILLTLGVFYGFNPLIVSLGLIAFYVFLGFLLVDRYTIGKGYLYIVFKDFLIYTLVFTFIFWVLSDLFFFYILPALWKLFVEWYMNSEGWASEIIGSAVYEFLNPLINELIEALTPYVEVYVYTSPVKFLSLLAVYLYFIHLSRRRENKLKTLFERLKKRA